MMGTNKQMSHKPKEWNDEKSMHPFAITVFMAFLLYLTTVIKVKPSVAFNYGAGVTWFLRQMGVDTEQWANTIQLRSLKSAMQLSHRLTNPQAEEKTLPFTTEALMFAKHRLYNDGSMTSLGIILEFQTQLLTLARIGEMIYLPGNSRHHHIKANDVEYGIKSERNAKIMIISSTEAHKVKKGEVQEVIITIRDSKSDVEGEGYKFNFKTDLKGAFNITKDMFNWSRKTKSEPDDPFFSYRKTKDTATFITYDQINGGVKETMRHLGFQENRFSTHSLRIGGASALAQAGTPEYVIKKMGKWKSMAFLQYIKISTDIFSKAAEAIADPKTFTLHALRRISTGVHVKDKQTIQI